jgi:uncharacterized membrane protein YtjA (UPF0391 family)
MARDQEAAPAEGTTGGPMRLHPKAEHELFRKRVSASTEHARVAKTLDWSPKMFGLVVTLLIIALVAGVLGFGGIAGTAVGMAKLVFLIAIVLLLVSLLFGGLRGGFRRGL